MKLYSYYTFSKVAGYMFNSKTSVDLLYTNDKWIKKEITEITPFTITTNSVKYFFVILTKQVIDLYDKNLMFLKKLNIIRRWQDLPCS